MAILMWDPTINLIKVIRFQNLFFIAIATSVVFMDFLYAVTVCKIVYKNDVRMETHIIMKSCFVALRNIKSHHAFPSDVKIECPIVLVFNDQDGSLLV